MTGRVLLRCLPLMALLLIVAGPVAQAKTFKIATVSPDGLGWMKKLREGVKEIENRTEGRVKIKLYPGGVQGDDFTVLRKMRIGQLHGGAVAASTLTRFYPDLQVYNLPLQFRTQEEVDYVRERMDQRIIDGLAEGGMVSFSLTETGFAYMLTNEPVADIEDLKKVKAWVPEGDPISARLIQSFGISPIPLGLQDVLAGLQTGLIDAVAVPPIVALALQWHNHVKYVTRLPLLYIYSMLAMDQKAFNSMSPADQQVVTEVMNRVFAEVDADNRLDNRKAYDALIAQGIQEVEPTSEQLEAWRAKATQSVDELVAAGEISSESLTILRKYLQEYRAGQGN
ncbi:MAG: TRAP transporter substrate-binding protein DctP [Pseudomonadales bacterium]|nr:TRAP transporter substrate-binding protein DctP [Pseudomonadales bacterium]